MKEIIVQAYQYSELDDDAKHNVKCWLDKDEFESSDPLAYQNDPKTWEYYNGMDEKDIIDRCNANEYLFSIWGEPIHHLEKKEVVI